ncbi:hypothetical protein E27107_60204 [Elizabethkingia anophelis]|nr:hypothetical protein E18064_190003 [Elizabethkingia anophelis]CDN79630.1 hypothetical protein E27107_60204 [Elizabethkingia anophelis]
MIVNVFNIVFMNINFKYYCHKYIYEIKIKTDLYYYLLYFVTFGKLKIENN